MKRQSTALPTLTIALMLLISLTVLSCLCAGALRRERRAAALSQAVVLVDSTADLFYAADSEEELAELLNSKVHNNYIVVNQGEGSCLTVTLSREAGLQQAEISFLSGGEELFGLRCVKFTGMGGD